MLQTDSPEGSLYSSYIHVQKYVCERERMAGYGWMELLSLYPWGCAVRTSTICPFFSLMLVCLCACVLYFPPSEYQVCRFTNHSIRCSWHFTATGFGQMGQKFWTLHFFLFAKWDIDPDNILHVAEAAN